MSMTVDVDGSGDLGRSKLFPVTALELEVLVPHIAHILSELRKESDTTKQFKYCFEISLYQMNSALLVIKSAKLPSNVEFLKIGDATLFEIRGPSGGVIGTFACYLITKGDDE